MDLDFFVALFYGRLEPGLAVFETVDQVDLQIHSVTALLNLQLDAILLNESLLLHWVTCARAKQVRCSIFRAICYSFSFSDRSLVAV